MNVSLVAKLNLQLRATQMETDPGKQRKSKVLHSSDLPAKRLYKVPFKEIMVFFDSHDVDGKL